MDPKLILPLDKAWSESARQAAAEARKSGKKADREMPVKVINQNNSERLAKLPDNHPEKRATLREIDRRVGLLKDRLKEAEFKNQYSGRPSHGGRHGDIEKQDIRTLLQHKAIIEGRDPWDWKNFVVPD